MKRKTFQPPVAAGGAAATPSPAAAGARPTAPPAVRRPFKLPSLRPAAAVAPVASPRPVGPLSTDGAATGACSPAVAAPLPAEPPAVKPQGVRARRPATIQTPTPPQKQLPAPSSSTAEECSTQPAPTPPQGPSAAAPTKPGDMPAALPPAPAALPPAPATAGWVVQRLPVVMPEELPAPVPNAGLPPVAQLLRGMPVLGDAPAAALVPLNHPALGDLSAAAAVLESAVFGPAAQLPPDAAEDSRTPSGCSIQMLAAALACHAGPPASRSRIAGLLSGLHPPPHKLVLAPHGAGTAAGAAAPAHCALRKTSAAAASQRACVTVPGVAATSGEATVVLRMSGRRAVPPPLDVAAARRQLGESAAIPLSYLQSVLAAA